MQIKYQVAGCGNRAEAGSNAGANADFVAGFRDAAKRFRLRKSRQGSKQRPLPQSLLDIQIQAFRPLPFEEAAWLALALSGLAMTALGIWSAR